MTYSPDWLCDHSLIFAFWGLLPAVGKKLSVALPQLEKRGGGREKPADRGCSERPWRMNEMPEISRNQRREERVVRAGEIPASADCKCPCRKIKQINLKYEWATILSLL